MVDLFSFLKKYNCIDIIVRTLGSVTLSVSGEYDGETFPKQLAFSDFVYIDDVVNATIAGMEVPEANGHVFNIGTGIATDVLTVAKTLCKHYGIDVSLNVSGNYRLGDIRHNYADISLAKKIFGFKPKWTFDQGIKQFTEWVNKQELQKDNYEASLEEMKQKGLFK